MRTYLIGLYTCCACGPGDRVRRHGDCHRKVERRTAVDLFVAAARVYRNRPRAVVAGPVHVDLFVLEFRESLRRWFRRLMVKGTVVVQLSGE